MLLLMMMMTMMMMTVVRILIRLAVIKMISTSLLPGER